MIFRFLRAAATAPIRVYQYCLSPLFPPRCRFRPTCSAYACEAIMAHGVLKGGMLALGRILRCHPWNEGGYDPVPPRPAKNVRGPAKRRGAPSGPPQL